VTCQWVRTHIALLNGFNSEVFINLEVHRSLKYYLILVVDGIDFVWGLQGQTCTTRSTPEDLIQKFLTMTNLKVSSVRLDGAQEFANHSLANLFVRRRSSWKLSLIIRIFKIRARKMQYSLPSDPHNRSAWERLDAISPGQKPPHDAA
jgi:hypothetical protein